MQIHINVLVVNVQYIIFVITISDPAKVVNKVDLITSN